MGVFWARKATRSFLVSTLAKVTGEKRPVIPGHEPLTTAHKPLSDPSSFQKLARSEWAPGTGPGGGRCTKFRLPPHPCLHVPPGPAWALDLPSAILGGPGRQALGKLLLAVRQARSSRRYWSKVAVRMDCRLVIPRAWGADSVALFPRGTAAFLGTVRRGLGSVG